MLKTNTVFYFDSSDFINISHHYIDQANFSLADKAIKMGLDQHPNNVDLMLLNSELLIFNSDYKKAYKILNFIEEIDPENREVYLQKATIYSKNNLSEEAIDILKRALVFIDDKIEISPILKLLFLCKIQIALLYFLLIGLSFRAFNGLIDLKFFFSNQFYL